MRREVLDVRLGGGVVDHGRAGRERGRHERVLGAHHRRLVHEEVARAQAAGGRLERGSGVDSTTAPSARKASRCGSRRRRPITSPPGGGICTRPKRASSGPASRNDARIRSDSSGSTSVAGDLVGLERDDVVLAPLHLHAQAHEQLEHRLHVADARDVAHDDLLLGEQGGRQRGQRAVLVAGRHDRAGQRLTAFDHELLHGAGEAARVPKDTLAPGSLRCGIPCRPMQPTRQEAWELVDEWVA